MKYTVHMMDDTRLKTLCGKIWDGTPEIHQTDLVKMCDICRDVDFRTRISSSPQPPEGPTDEEILTAVSRFWEGMGDPSGWLETPYPTDDPKLRQAYTEKQIEDKMYEMSERGILEYGVSVRTAWIISADYQAPHGLTPDTMRIISKVFGDK